MSLSNGKSSKRGNGAAASLKRLRAGAASNLRSLVGGSAVPNGPVERASARDLEPAPDLLEGERFLEQLHRELARARRTRRPASLLLIEARDVAGEDGARMGDAIRAQKRKVDVAGRIADSRYALVLPETDEAGALQAARRLRGEIARSCGNEPIAVSLGVATYPRHAKHESGLMRAAERALAIVDELADAAPLLRDAELPATVASVPSHEADPERELGALLSLAETADARARGRAGHSQRVARYAALIAHELGLDPPEVRELKLAAILHDIGNVAVPEAVLRKTGPLSDEEWGILRSHCEVGARLVESTGLEQVRLAILHHHERVDGSGYPQGLRGAAIPLGARIVAVADAFEAMTKDRPHRAAMPKAAAEQELIDCCDTQFDRRVVDAFLRALARRAHSLPLGNAA
jgi:putative nucleotidyltransferase with HDIG domain